MTNLKKVIQNFIRDEDRSLTVLISGSVLVLVLGLIVAVAAVFTLR